MVSVDCNFLLCTLAVSDSFSFWPLRILQKYQTHQKRHSRPALDHGLRLQVHNNALGVFASDLGSLLDISLIVRGLLWPFPLSEACKMVTSLRISCLIYISCLLRAAFGATISTPPPGSVHPPPVTTNWKSIPLTTALTGSLRNESGYFNHSSTGGSTCQIQDAYCTLQGSGHALDGMRDICALWDDSCSGDKTLAANTFFSSKSKAVLSNTCFFGDVPYFSYPGVECTASNPPGRMSVFNDLINWMRTPQCLSVVSNYNSRHPGKHPTENRNCCGSCSLNADRVDIFYWQDPDADTSCLSIIDDPDVAKGATVVYDTRVITGDTVVDSQTMWLCTNTEHGQSTVYTNAFLQNEDSMTWRDYGTVVNPWDTDSLCGGVSTSSHSYGFTKTQRMGGASASRLTNMHSMNTNNSRVSTVVSGQHTL